MVGECKTGGKGSYLRDVGKPAAIFRSAVEGKVPLPGPDPRLNPASSPRALRKISREQITGE